MMATFPETETTASRVLYVNSKDATAIFNNNRADFDFNLEEPIVIPEHHAILMSVYSAEIPYSFYNFRDNVNTILDYQETPFTVPATYDINGFLDLTAGGYNRLILPQGNYNAVELANHLTTNIPNLECAYDPIRLKFSFQCSLAGARITLALRNGPLTGTATSPGNDMNEELGFDFNNITGDPFVERDGAGLNAYWHGSSNGNPGVAGTGIDATRLGPFLLPPVFFLFSDDVIDMTNSIRSLFIRTNLSTSSILDSHIGGGFSNILCRVPINTEAGGIITIEPSNGHIHQLLLKVKAITNISLRLTNQKNTTIDLNGLDFDISLKLDFIETKYLPEPPGLRQLIDDDNIVADAQRKEEEKLKEKQKKPRRKKTK